jgi:glycosyltransferase involved in cell wall biosynthesis
MAGRTPCLKVCLASAIQEALAYPKGMVEVLVSVNGSPEPTLELLRQFQQQHPWIRCMGFPEDRGFDVNYLNCFKEARGEFVWVMGDDDMFLPGSLAPVLAAIDAGADAILCAAYECDAQMKPLQPRGWFKQPTPARTWRIDGRQDLIDYYDSLQYEAGAFGFISAGIIRRERFLNGLPVIQRGMGTHFVHVLGMMAFMAAPTSLHWIPQPLFLNRTGNDGWAVVDPYGRLIHDMNAWITFADICYPEQDALRRAFMGVLRSNHQDQMIRSLRLASGADQARWREARRHLLAVGFDPVLVSAVDLSYGVFMLETATPGHLDPEGVCLADLALVTRGARRIAVLAEVGLADFLAATPLLEALRRETRAAVRVVCPQELAPLLEGFDLQIIDRDRFLRDDAAMNAQQDTLRAFAPDLLVNLDRQRGVVGDLLVMAAGAAGVLGFDNETAENRQDALRLQRGRHYRRLLPRDAPAGQLAEALGLPSGPQLIWLDQACQARARNLLAETGWDPGRTLGVLADDPGALTGPGALKLERAVRDRWAAIGLGGPGTEPVLGHALRPFGARARNLGGTLPLADMAALLQLCGAYTAGSALFQSLARAAGCSPYAPRLT